MAEKHAIGIKTFESGAIAAGGGMGATLTELPGTVRGEFTMTTTEPTVKTYHINNKPRPVEALMSGDTVESLEVSFYDMSAATLELLLGGTALTGTYSANTEIPQIELSFKIETKNGFIIEIVRGLVAGSIDWDLNDDGIGMVKAKITILEPTDGTSEAYTIAEPVVV